MTKIEAERIDVGWIDPGTTKGLFTLSLGATIRDMEYHGCMGTVFRESSSLPVLSRNHLIRRFLEESDSPWIWLVDADMIFNKGHPMMLWEAASEHGVKMVSGLAFIWAQGQERPVPSVYYDHTIEEGFEPGELVQAGHKVPSRSTPIEATGLASSLIHREVFEAMPIERFDSYRWFDIDRINPKGKPFGEDLQFFVRAKELGYQLVLEPRATTWHIKDVGIGFEDWKRAWNV